MFEGALVESRGQLGSPVVRWTAVGSLALQLGIAAVLVTVPLLRPETLRMLARAPELVTPAVPRPPAAVVRVRRSDVTPVSPLSAPAVTRVEAARGTMRMLLPGTLGQDAPGPVGPMVLSMSPGGGAVGDLALGRGSGSGVAVVRAAPAGPLRVSSGVSAGLLLSAIQPVYPALAKAARVEGTVVVEAVISTTGRIESAHAVSGPELLKRAALDAVANARYRPFALNGQPVEVQTTVTVNFRLGG